MMLLDVFERKSNDEKGIMNLPGGYIAGRRERTREKRIKNILSVIFVYNCLLHTLTTA